MGSKIEVLGDTVEKDLFYDLSKSLPNKNGKFMKIGIHLAARLEQ